MEKNRLMIAGRLLTGASTAQPHMTLVQGHPCVGYVPGAEALNAVKALAIRLRERNLDMVYLLDRMSLSTLRALI